LASSLFAKCAAIAFPRCNGKPTLEQLHSSRIDRKFVLSIGLEVLVMKIRGFHISVTTGLEYAGDPSVLGGLSLDHDLRLVKAALLYADDVTLYSPAASLALSVGNVKNLRMLEQIEMLEYLIPFIVTVESDRPRSVRK